MEKVKVGEETVYINKGKLGWSVVHQIKNKDGSINWKNLIAGGSWWKLLFIGLFVLIAVGAINEYTQIARIANTCLNNGGNLWILN